MNRSRPTYMSAKRRRHIDRLIAERRKLSAEHIERAQQMRSRGMTYPAIARWFSNNVTAISWQTAKRACERVA